MQTLLIQVLAAQHRCRQCRAADAGIRIIDDAAEMMRQQGITAVQQGRCIVIEREDEALSSTMTTPSDEASSKRRPRSAARRREDQVAQPRPQLVRQDGLGHIVVNAEVNNSMRRPGLSKAVTANRHPALR